MVYQYHIGDLRILRFINASKLFSKGKLINKEEKIDIVTINKTNAMLVFCKSLNNDNVNNIAPN
jgi:hypothetical protein